MAGIIDGAEIEIPCENCGRKTNKSIGWIKTNTNFICDCGTRIVLDSDKLRREISKADRAIDEFQAQLKKFNK